MASVAVVSYDVQTVGGHAGGVGAFVSNLARLLSEHGERVTIIYVSASTPALSIDECWRANYARWGISILEVHCPPASNLNWQEAWPARLSERVAPHLRQFDVVYLQDWANAGFRAIRERRFSTGPGPAFVTVLHGPSAWVRGGNRQLPGVPLDLQIDFIERYSEEHSDRVVAPSRYIAGWLRQKGWLRGEPEVLALPYHPEAAGSGTVATAITRLVFFGRLEVRKGFEVFADALRLLCAKDPEILSSIKHIVLMGQEQTPGSAARLRRILAVTGVTVTHLADLDSESAHNYLVEHAPDSLVVIPSPQENFPYAVIEALSIGGLNVICSCGGGIPEVFASTSEAQLFHPSPEALAAKLAERLRNPLGPEQLAVYDYTAANARWIEFHRGVCAGHNRVEPSRAPDPQPTVDVCITYFNKGRYFQQLLDALAAQTEADFRVIAIDDGSTDAHSRSIFDAAAREYSPRGWKFLRQANAFVDAARNRAAKLSQADYLLFLDADDVPVLHAVARLRAAAQASGVDCLLCGGWLFDSDEPPKQAERLIGYMPLGPDLVGGMVDPMVLGLPMILIRRAVFEEVGGYREVRGAGHEDWELQVRLLLAGFQTDVLPEYLLFFRRPHDGLTQTGDRFPARRRMMEAYEIPLRQAGVTGLAGALFELDQRCRTLQEKLIRNVPLALRMQLHESRNAE